jgi:MFS family permease
VTTGSDLDRRDSARRELTRRSAVERQAGVAFAVAALVLAIVCGAIIVSGWFAGVIEDRYERVFWAGAILALLSVLVLGLSVWPGGDDDRRATRRTRALLRVGLVMFLVSPLLCLGALIADFYG